MCFSWLTDWSIRRATWVQIIGVEWRWYGGTRTPYFLEWGVQYPPTFRTRMAYFLWKVVNLMSSSETQTRFILHRLSKTLQRTLSFPDMAENAQFCTDNLKKNARCAPQVLFLYFPLFTGKLWYWYWWCDIHCISNKAPWCRYCILVSFLSCCCSHSVEQTVCEHYDC